MKHLRASVISEAFFIAEYSLPAEDWDYEDFADMKTNHGLQDCMDLTD